MSEFADDLDDCVAQIAEGNHIAAGVGREEMEDAVRQLAGQERIWSANLCGCRKYGSTDPVAIKRFDPAIEFRDPIGQLSRVGHYNQLSLVSGLMGSFLQQFV
jgi:hypothetical protein